MAFGAQSYEPTMNKIKGRIVHSQMDHTLHYLSVYSVNDSLPKNIEGEAFRLFINKQMEKAGTGGSKDLWGTPYRWKLSGQELTMISDGADREPGTADDLRQSRKLSYQTF
jgi:hypothetical protein